MTYFKHPFKVEEFGKLTLPEKILRAYIFNTVHGTHLFALEEDKKLSLYILKSCTD